MLVVVALGGNAFLRRGAEPTQEEHLLNIKIAARVVAEIVGEGHKVVVTHGNGPQVGALDELQAAADRRYLKLDALGAATQGFLGYFIAQSIDEELGTFGAAVAVVTRTLVRGDDPAFSNPTKFVGVAYPEDAARRLAEEHGWVMKLDKGKGWRRVVPSPEPLDMIEVEAIRSLVDAGHVVVAAGGGGVPIADREGVEAVVDKDLASQILANRLGADTLVILTDVDGVYMNFGTERQRRLGRVSAGELEKYYLEGHFPAGSMGPKVLAALRFVRGGGKWAAIGLLEEGYEVFAQRSGTIITP